MTDAIILILTAILVVTCVCLRRVEALSGRLRVLNLTVVAHLNSTQSDVFDLRRAMHNVSLLDNIGEVTRYVVVLEEPPLRDEKQRELDKAWSDGRFDARPRPGDLMMHNGAEYMHNGKFWRYAVDGRGRKRR